MLHWISGLIALLGALQLATCCYDECIQNFTIEIDKISQSTNRSGLFASEFCRAMSNQVECLRTVSATCPSQQKTLIESLLSVFILPDYHRTCTGNATKSIPAASSWTGTNGLIPTGGLNYPAIVPTSGQTLMICRAKFQTCQNSFNSTFTANMALYNISGLCQAVKNYTVCFISLLSSECGHLIPRNLIYNMQRQYGGMCSNDAQANTNTMIKCANLTMKCYTQFNSSFSPAANDYNLMIMCGVIDNYTKCMQDMSHTNECSQFITQGLSGIQQLKTRHSAFCGDDNGRTANQCVQRFQDCFSPFNVTFFPGLHTANLTVICSSLKTYAACVSRLSPTCSQQFGQVLQSVQTLKTQFAQKCHPNIIKLSSCDQIGRCSQVFMRNYSMGQPSGASICGSIGDYFPCIERGLDACQLPQSTTEVGFGDLGTLMKGYCDKLSSNTNLLHCPAFLKCSAAIWLSFSPSIRNLYEGSTWCTFLQLSIGCAEHALQSAACFLEEDVKLQQSIWEVDQLRAQTCEKGAAFAKDVTNNGEKNKVFLEQGKQSLSQSANDRSANQKSATASPGIVFLLLVTVVTSSQTLFN